MPRGSREIPSHVEQDAHTNADQTPDALRSAVVTEATEARKLLDPQVRAAAAEQKARARDAAAIQRVQDAEKIRRIKQELHIPDLATLVEMGESRVNAREKLLGSIKQSTEEYQSKAERKGAKEPIPLQEARLASIKAGAEKHLQKAKKNKEDEARTPSLTELRALSEQTIKKNSEQKALLKSIKERAEEHLSAAERNNKNKEIRASEDYKALADEANLLLKNKESEAFVQFVKDLKREAETGTMGMQEAAQLLLNDTDYEAEMKGQEVEDVSDFASIEDAEDAASFLGIPENATERQITRAFRTLSKKLHPDVGGSYEQWNMLQRAKELMLAKSEENEKEQKPSENEHEDLTQKIADLKGKEIPFNRMQDGEEVVTLGTFYLINKDKGAVLMEYIDSDGELQREEVKMTDLLAAQEKSSRAQKTRATREAAARERTTPDTETADEQDWLDESENQEAFEELRSLADAMAENPGDMGNIAEARALLKSKKEILGGYIDAMHDANELPMDQKDFAKLLTRVEAMEKAILATEAAIKKEKNGSFFRRLGFSKSAEQKHLEASLVTDQKDLKTMKSQIEDFMQAFDNISPKTMTERGRGEAVRPAQKKR